MTGSLTSPTIALRECGMATPSSTQVEQSASRALRALKSVSTSRLRRGSTTIVASSRSTASLLAPARFKRMRDRLIAPATVHGSGGVEAGRTLRRMRVVSINGQQFICREYYGGIQRCARNEILV